MNRQQVLAYLAGLSFINDAEEDDIFDKEGAQDDYRYLVIESATDIYKNPVWIIAHRPPLEAVLGVCSGMLNGAEEAFWMPVFIIDMVADEIIYIRWRAEEGAHDKAGMEYFKVEKEKTP